MEEQVSERIVEKLRKVLALTNSPMEGEAQAAAYKLEELLTMYNLNMADLEMKGAAVTSKVQENDYDLGKAAFTWKLDLAEGIANFYYCHPIVDRKAKTVLFVGRKDNVESLKMLYGWLVDQIKRISSDERKSHILSSGEHIDPLRWQVNFGIGAAKRLKERLKERALREREANQAITALVVHHESEISDYLEKTYGYRTDGKRTAQQEAWHKEYMERQKAREELKARDIEAYYDMYPWERPLSEAEQKKRDAKYAKQQARRDKAWERQYHNRRTKTYSKEELRTMEQKGRSKDAGYKAGNKINLEPFVEDKNEKKEAVN